MIKTYFLFDSRMESFGDLRVSNVERKGSRLLLMSKELVQKVF